MHTPSMSCRELTDVTFSLDVFGQFDDGVVLGWIDRAHMRALVLGLEIHAKEMLLFFDVELVLVKLFGELSMLIEWLDVTERRT